MGAWIPQTYSEQRLKGPISAAKDLERSHRPSNWPAVSPEVHAGTSSPPKDAVRSPVLRKPLTEGQGQGDGKSTSCRHSPHPHKKLYDRLRKPPWLPEQTEVCAQPPPRRARSPLQRVKSGCRMASRALEHLKRPIEDPNLGLAANGLTPLDPLGDTESTLLPQPARHQRVVSLLSIR